MPMCTFEGTETDSVSTVTPLLSLVELYWKGWGVEVLPSVLMGLWIDARISD
jgi:hypothetical protein